MEWFRANWQFAILMITLFAIERRLETIQGYLWEINDRGQKREPPIDLDMP